MCFGSLSPIATIQLWKSGAITMAERRWSAVLTNSKNELAGDHFCLRSFFATESAFLAVLFSFNLLSEFQRVIDCSARV
jgi:hypothetical protein